MPSTSVQDDLLQVARNLRRKGQRVEAAAVQKLALQQSETTEPDSVVVDSSILPHDLGEDPDQYDHEVGHYLQWIGKELHPILGKLLKHTQAAILKDSNVRMPALVFKGIIESLKAYGFQALTGKTLPYHIYSVHTLPKNVPVLPPSPKVTAPAGGQGLEHGSRGLRASALEKSREARIAARKKAA